MATEIVNKQRKAIRDFYSNNDLYCDRLNNAEELSIKEKENDDNEAQEETSAFNYSIQELRGKISHFKTRAEKIIINVEWLPDILGSGSKKGDLSFRECYYQSIDQAKMKAELLEKYFFQYDKYLSIKKNKKSDNKLRNISIVLFIILIIYFVYMIIPK